MSEKTEKTQNSVSIPLTGEVNVQINVAMNVMVLDGELCVYKTRKEALDILGARLGLPEPTRKPRKSKVEPEVKDAA